MGILALVFVFASCTKDSSMYTPDEVKMEKIAKADDETTDGSQGLATDGVADDGDPDVSGTTDDGSTINDDDDDEDDDEGGSIKKGDPK